MREGRGARAGEGGGPTCPPPPTAFSAPRSPSFPTRAGPTGPPGACERPGLASCGGGRGWLRPAPAVARSPTRAQPSAPTWMGEEGQEGIARKPALLRFLVPSSPACPTPPHPARSPAAGREGAGAGSEPDSRGERAGGRGRGGGRRGAGPRADRWAKLGRNLNPRSEVRAWRTAAAAAAGAAGERGPAAGKRGARSPRLARRAPSPGRGTRDPAGARALPLAPGPVRPRSVAGKVGGTWGGRAAQPAERGSGLGSCSPHPRPGRCFPSHHCLLAWPCSFFGLLLAAPFAVRGRSCAPELLLFPAAHPLRPWVHDLGGCLRHHPRPVCLPGVSLLPTRRRDGPGALGRGAAFRGTSRGS